MSDDMVNRETKLTEKENAVEKYKTALKKMQFISELKNGLGKEIKKNPSKAKFIKKTPYEKFIAGLKKIFTKF